MYLEPDGAFFKRTRDDTVSLLTWVDDVEKTDPTEYWTLGHDATATFDHFELTNEQTDTVPFRVTENDKVEVADFGVSGAVTDTLHLGATETRLSGFDSENRHWVQADAAGNDQIVAVEQFAASDYALYVSEGDQVSRVLTTGDATGGNADTLDGLDSTQFIRKDAEDQFETNVGLNDNELRLRDWWDRNHHIAYNDAIDGTAVHGLNGIRLQLSDPAAPTTALEVTADADVEVPNGTISQQGNAVLTTASSVGMDVENTNGSPLVENVDALYAGTELSFSDDGDGTATISYTGATDLPSGWSGDTTTTSGDGSQTTFTLTHDLGAVPDSVNIEATSRAASTDFWVSNVTDTAIDVTYPTAPPSGTDNLSWYVTTTTSNLRSVTVSDDDAVIASSPDDINFGADLSVADDGDGSVTITAGSDLANTTASETVSAAWHFDQGVGVGPGADVALTNSSQTTQFAWAYDDTDDRAVFADVANATDAIETDRTGVVNFPQNAQISGTDIATVDDVGDGGGGGSGTTTTTSVTRSGDGSTRTFTLGHSLGSTPAGAFVQPTTPAAMSDFHVSNKTSSDVVITYARAPPSGTDNLEFDVITHA